MGRECHDVTSHWSYFGRQVTCPHNFCQDCSIKTNFRLARDHSKINMLPFFFAMVNYWLFIVFKMNKYYCKKIIYKTLRFLNVHKILLNIQYNQNCVIQLRTERCHALFECNFLIGLEFLCVA